MIKRTSQVHNSTLTFPSGNTFTLLVPASTNSSTELKFAVRSAADTGLHWHEQHTEFFEVLQGVGKLTLENPSGILEIHYVSRTNGIVTIPRYRRHCLGRGDEGFSTFSVLGAKVAGDTQPQTEDWRVDLLVREWTDPKDGQKEIFFRNLAGIVHDSTSWPWTGQAGKWIGSWWTEWQIWVVYGTLDNYPAIFGGEWKSMEWVIVHVLCLILGFLGRLVGLRNAYDEYTPMNLRGGGRSEEKKDQ